MRDSWFEDNFLYIIMFGFSFFIILAGVLCLLHPSLEEGLIYGKYHVPASYFYIMRNSERWVLQIDKDGKKENISVSKEVWDSINIGDYYRRK